jgi:hypothetical protein
VTKKPQVETPEIEISYDDYQEFIKYKEMTNDLKKKNIDPSWIMYVLKTASVALLPALLAAIQRATTRTIEQHQTPSKDFITQSVPTGPSQSDPLQAPQF